MLGKKAAPFLAVPHFTGGAALPTGPHPTAASWVPMWLLGTSYGRATEAWRSCLSFCLGRIQREVSPPHRWLTGSFAKPIHQMSKPAVPTEC